MFNEQYEYMVSLFKKVQQEIGGYVLCKDYDVVYLMKEDILLNYQFADRDDIALFLFLTPFSLDKVEFSIERKRSKIVSVFLDGHMKEILDFTVSATQERGGALMTSLFNDYAFKNQLSSKLKDWKIEYKDETLSFLLPKNAQPLFGKSVEVNEIIEMFDFIKEVKDALTFYDKRV